MSQTTKIFNVNDLFFKYGFPKWQKKNYDDTTFIKYRKGERYVKYKYVEILNHIHVVHIFVQFMLVINIVVKFQKNSFPGYLLSVEILDKS